MLEQGDLRWGIVGVELRRRHTVDLLAAQDHLYTVTERDSDGARTRIVGAVHGALFAPESLPALLALIADPAVSIVSLTVTEKGYCRRPGGGLDLDDPALKQDLATPDTPRTALGVIAAGLRLRPAHAPLSIVCCDNMTSNGDTLRALLIDYAEHVDGDLPRGLPVVDPAYRVGEHRAVVLPVERRERGRDGGLAHLVGRSHPRLHR